MLQNTEAIQLTIITTELISILLKLQLEIGII